MRSPPSIADQLRACATRWEGSPRDVEAIVARIGSARIVLIGEASHGTHEFYRVRAEITKRLIRDGGFHAVAVEADWPDAYRVNRYVRGRGDDQEAIEALGGFERFPRWMWRNADVLDFVGWLRAWNEAHPANAAGFYGLDLYSMHRSMDAVLKYLEVVDPEAEKRARYRYSCFEDFGEDPQAYGYAASFGLSAPCEKSVVTQLVELQHSIAAYVSRDGRLEPGDHFFAEQNARLVVDAESYYRAMFAGRAASWNLRDQHMMRTLESIDDHLRERARAPAKIVVWAHNSHLGDARATEMKSIGELNVGQLVRQRYGKQSVSIGFSTFAGTVTAASDWDGLAERKRVRDALPGSWEHAIHGLGLGNVCFDFKRWPATRTAASLLERAIGVIYRPDTERASHYFEADLPRQFDALIHFDRTRAVEPLERTAVWQRGELPETYPSAL